MPSYANLSKAERSEQRKKDREWRLAHPGTHTELTDPHLRLILANELLVLRNIARVARKRGSPFTSGFLGDIKMGLDTALRRVEDVGKNGMENVYAQNYPKKE